MESLDEIAAGDDDPMSTTNLVGATDFYELLDVPTDASTEEIEEAYRRRLTEAHPDQADEGEKERAQKETKQLRKAKEILTDEDWRGIYDIIGHDELIGAPIADEQRHGMLQDLREEIRAVDGFKKAVEQMGPSPASEAEDESAEARITPTEVEVESVNVSISEGGISISVTKETDKGEESEGGASSTSASRDSQAPDNSEATATDGRSTADERSGRSSSPSGGVHEEESSAGAKQGSAQGSVSSENGHGETAATGDKQGSRSRSSSEGPSSAHRTSVEDSQKAPGEDPRRSSAEGGADSVQASVADQESVDAPPQSDAASPAEDATSPTDGGREPVSDDPWPVTDQELEELEKEKDYSGASPGTSAEEESDDDYLSSTQEAKGAVADLPALNTRRWLARLLLSTILVGGVVVAAGQGVLPIGSSLSSTAILAAVAGIVVVVSGLSTARFARRNESGTYKQDERAYFTHLSRGWILTIVAAVLYGTASTPGMAWDGTLQKLLGSSAAPASPIWLSSLPGGQSLPPVADVALGVLFLGTSTLGILELSRGVSMRGWFHSWVDGAHFGESLLWDLLTALPIGIALWAIAAGLGGESTVLASVAPLGAVPGVMIALAAAVVLALLSRGRAEIAG